ncbi:MAG: xanthine dehydrogenase family protein molybdopterin-binding subunit [Clostridiales bacterium]|nr:xanthine dehydrogenase family protein molybdopterin-binding subunit [Clostridiales bacterium]
MNLKIIGTSPDRLDAAAKTTGEALYTADMKFPNMLHMKVLRSPHAHARILGMDVTRAQKAPGVVRVVTGRDVPGPFGEAVRDQYPIARDKVRYAGEPVAVAVAADENTAAAALDLIRVDYEPLPFVLDPWEALNQTSPVIHEGLMEYKTAPFVMREGHNTYQHMKVRKGDAQTALAAADLVVEGEFRWPPNAHTQMETLCAVACYQRDKSLTIYATTQAPFIVQSTIAELLEIPPGRVRVVSPILGGGFGGKSDVTIEALVACVARFVPGRHACLTLTREEMFNGATHGRSAACRYQIGFRKDGRLTAIVGESVMASGGNADYAVNIITGMALAGAGPYRVDNVRLDVYGVYTNAPPIGAFRGYGHPEVHLALESLMDTAAEKLGIAPYTIRDYNLLRAGDANAIGQVMSPHSGNVAECAKLLSEKLSGQQLPQAVPHCRVGRGMAAYMKMPCMPSNAQSGAFIKLNPDGGVTISTGAVDMGQGLHTTLGQIVAERLGLPFSKISFNATVDTLISPYDWQTVASRSTWGAGNAMLLAADDLLRKLREQGAAYFGVSPDDVETAGGEIRAGERSLPWGKFAAGLRGPDGAALTRPVTGEGYFVPQGVVNPDPETGQGNAAPDWTMGCAGAEVSVDMRTGEITVLRLINVIDAGTIINPKNAAEQVSGAMLMSLGAALSETVIFDKKTGCVRNNSLVDYKIPGIEDVPGQVDVYFVETPEESGPYGAKGLGEHGIVGTAPAILNAIYNATGIRFHSLPVSADRLIAGNPAIKGGE